METKEVRRIRLIGRICELVERSGGVTFMESDIKINGIVGSSPYEEDGVNIFRNGDKVTWDDLEFETLEELVEIIHESNLGITF